MGAVTVRLLDKLLHRGDAESPLCFYDVLHRRWINLTPGQHLAVIGVTGAGKSALIGGILTNLEAYVTSGEAVIYGIDLKQGIELNRYGGYIRQVASTLEQTVELLRTLNDEMDRRARILLDGYRNQTETSRDMPMILVIVDEAAELTGATDKALKQLQEEARNLLDRILRLGRALGFTAVLASQDPRKESLSLRDRCPVRLGLRLNSREETGMALGDTAIRAGAACWLIGIRQPGTGYMFDADTGRVLRFRTPTPMSDEELARLRARHPRIDVAHATGQGCRADAAGDMGEPQAMEATTMGTASPEQRLADR
ncbi:FtsK/SpoIIIE domain-containing protein [Bifidobacterium sp. SO4]|uniref:FtsK/SpoIIIE domain-containing protein n=1 Tax=Bifidobacterium sp. SO4 TaxID=2809030 RepID=UPI001BDBE087|nr:FtsK/SpoIIIE domain-containing protein [Bifidobacterium sp. SO4]MBT1171005.1 ATP-binding cassette domain-containing protein [Bifidobacterium sp. SO4]